MCIEKKWEQFGIRTSLNMIYVLSRSVDILMPLDGEEAANALLLSSELILQEAEKLHQRILTNLSLGKETKC